MTGRSTRKAHITDRKAGELGFSRFERVGLSEDGQAISVRYESGAAYFLPGRYLLSWFREAATPSVTEPSTSILKVRRLPGSESFRVYLSGGETRDVAWDSVLMAMEPSYEHYEGLTDGSKALVRAWARGYTGDLP
jgi:hypothetical protein